MSEVDQSRRSPPFKVHDLGEIAIRCADIDAMMAFYRDIVGLEVLSDARDDGIVFFRICDGHGGHATVLALFKIGAGRNFQRGSGRVDVPSSSLHHLALTVAFEDQPKIEQWLRENGVAYRVEVFGWIGWRGVFVNDPEGNTVEFVAADKSLLDADARYR